MRSIVTFAPVRRDAVPSAAQHARDRETSPDAVREVFMVVERAVLAVKNL